jgi:uncharacterized membrane protein
VPTTNSSETSQTLVTIQENIEKNKYIPVPYLICAFVFLLTVIVAKFQAPETFIPGAIVGFVGLLEWASWITLALLIISNWGIYQRSLTGLLIGIVINFILNFINLAFYKRNIYSDPTF